MQIGLPPFGRYSGLNRVPQQFGQRVDSDVFRVPPQDIIPKDIIPSGKLTLDTEMARLLAPCIEVGIQHQTTTGKPVLVYVDTAQGMRHCDIYKLLASMLSSKKLHDAGTKAYDPALLLVQVNPLTQAQGKLPYLCLVTDQGQTEIGSYPNANTDGNTCARLLDRTFSALREARAEAQSGISSRVLANA